MRPCVIQMSDVLTSHLTTASGVKLYVQPINGFGAEFPQFALEAALVL